MLVPGSKFPDFSLRDQDDKVHTLSQYKGKWIIVYFYPKDDTPGCTVQGKAFTETKSKFESLKTKILGVSADDVQSHKNFCNKFGFKIDLLADTNADLLKACGIGQSEFKGNKYWDRSSIVVDPEGMVRKVYSKVNAEGHESILLEDLIKLQQQS